MKTKALNAAQIDTLAQRLSDTPIKPTTSANKRAIPSPACWPRGSGLNARRNPSPRS